MKLRDVCAFGLISMCLQAQAVPVLDIDLSPSVDRWAIGAGSKNYLYEQTYTAGITGRLQGIEFFYSRPLNDDSPFGLGATPETINFFVGVGTGFLSESNLYRFTVALPVSNAVTPFFVDVGAAGLDLSKGSNFIVGWRGTGLNDSYPQIYGSYTPIVNGVLDLNMGTGAMGQSAINPAIRTFVETSPVPEPMTISLLSVGIVLLMLKRSRRFGQV